MTGLPYKLWLVHGSSTPITSFLRQFDWIAQHTGFAEKVSLYWSINKPSHTITRLSPQKIYKNNSLIISFCSLLLTAKPNNRNQNTTLQKIIKKMWSWPFHDLLTNQRRWLDSDNDKLDQEKFPAVWTSTSVCQQTRYILCPNIQPLVTTPPLPLLVLD